MNDNAQPQTCKRCFLCYREYDPVVEKKLSEANGKKRNETEIIEEKGNSNGTENMDLLESQISVMILLRKFLDVPKDTCRKLLQHYGNPSSWIFWCVSCSVLVKEAENVFNHIKVLNKKVEKLRSELKNVIIQSQSDGNGKEQNNSSAGAPEEFVDENHRRPTEIIRASVSKSVVKPKIRMDSNMDECLVEDIPKDNNFSKENLPENEIMSKTTMQHQDLIFIRPCTLRVLVLEEAKLDLPTEKEKETETHSDDGSNHNDVEDEDWFDEGANESDNKNISPRRYLKNGTRKSSLKLTDVKENPNLECLECGESFSVMTHLKCHERLHTKKTLLVCSVCSKPFLSKNDLRRHELTHTQEKCHKCSVCLQTFSSRETLLRHHRIHAGKKRFACKFCEKSFMHKASLQYHWERHADKEILCTRCGQTFSSVSELNCHKQIHDKRTKEEKTQHCCSFCGKTFSKVSVWKIHERTHTGEKPYECKLCEKKFGYLLSLKEHQRTHTGEKPFECSVCKKRFTRHGEMKKHEETHTEGNQYLCPICGKGYRRSSFLKWHQEDKHANEKVIKKIITKDGEVKEWPNAEGKRYSCSYCGKPFRHKNDFVKHERTHTREKPYSCKDCDKKFAISSHLNIHRRRHTGEFPHSCATCGKKFTNRTNLKQHEKSHSDERPFPCPLCSKSFRQKHGLQKHCLQTHGLQKQELSHAKGSK